MVLRSSPTRSSRFSADFGPVVVLTLLMVVTMTLSDVLNNTATTVIAAPIAVDIAGRLGTSPDPFLMAVAVAASCAFLTPIGHKNNTLVMGPGGYRFGDYWRMGLPLEIVVIMVSIPAILVFWPFLKGTEMWIPDVPKWLLKRSADHTRAVTDDFQFGSN